MENESSVETREEFPSSQMERRLIGLLPMFILVLIIVLRISWTLYKSFGQKTRNPQQRRIYAGSRPRASLTPHEPTIYVSPSNLPPPPKYECMAPPSYEEVVGVHYPNLQQQPIAQPITAALAQNAQSNNSNTPANNAPVQPINNPVPTTATVTTVNERQTTTSS